MEQLKVRFAQAEDTNQVAEWLTKTPENLFDPTILEYKTLRVLSSYNGKGNVAHLPTQQALMLESLAVNPASSLPERGQAFRDLVKGAELYASSFGIREMYFICKDPRVVNVAVNHGFEAITFPVVRLKL